MRGFQQHDQRRAIDDHQSDPALTIEALRKNIATLNVEADPALAAEIIGGFGQPVKETAQELKGPIEIGMKTISSHALNMTKQFQLRNPGPEMGAVDRWLTAFKQRYEDWLHRL